MKYKVLAFDFIGVLYGRGHINHEFTMPFLGLGPKDYPKVKRWYIKYKTGQVTKNEFWGAFGQDSQIEGKFLKKIRQESFNKDFLKLVKKLDKDWQIVAITDLPESWGIYLSNIPGDFTFDYEVISAWTGVEKDVSSKNFKEMLVKMKVRAGEVLFIDDKLPNLKKAGELGLATVWYKQEDQESSFRPDYTIEKLAEIFAII